MVNKEGLGNIFYLKKEPKRFVFRNGSIELERINEGKNKGLVKM